MLVIGLTGGIASGKTTVSKTLFGSYGIPVVDADLLAREAVTLGSPTLARIVSVFGPSILLPNGSLDRSKLGAVVFNDKNKRKLLNAIIHPVVRRAMLKAVLWHWLRGEEICVLDVPLLIESGIWRWVGKVVVVYCSYEIQLRRLQVRDSLSHEEAVARLSAQIPTVDKIQYADYVIDNSGSPQDLKEQVENFVKVLTNETKRWKWWWMICWLVPPFGLLSAVLHLSWRAIFTGRRLKRS